MNEATSAVPTTRTYVTAGGTEYTVNNVEMLQVGEESPGRREANALGQIAVRLESILEVVEWDLMETRARLNAALKQEAETARRLAGAEAKVDELATPLLPEYRIDAVLSAVETWFDSCAQRWPITEPEDVVLLDAAGAYLGREPRQPAEPEEGGPA